VTTVSVCGSAQERRFGDVDDFTHHGPNSTVHVRDLPLGHLARCDDCPWHARSWDRAHAVEAAVVHACEPHPVTSTESET
jgi:hypothetical protein